MSDGDDMALAVLTELIRQVRARKTKHAGKPLALSALDTMEALAMAEMAKYASTVRQ